jgi:hypothetical protein
MRSQAKLGNEKKEPFFSAYCPAQAKACGYIYSKNGIVRG